MRRWILAFVLAGAVVMVPGAANAGQATAPSSACNAGTMNAHSQVPGATGSGAAVEAHEHIPDLEDGACVHEAFA